MGARGRREIVEEGRLDVLQSDRDLVRSARLDRVDRREQRRGGADLPVAFERGHHVVRVEVLPVVELHALADREDVCPAIFADLHAFGELRDRLCVLVAGVESLEDVQRDVARGLRRSHVGVDRRRCLDDRDDDIPALSLRRGIARANQGDRAEHQGG